MESETRFELEVEVCRDMYQRSVLDATRARVVQFTRLGDRLDPIRRWRTPQFQRRFQRFGVIVSGVGASLSLSLLVCSLVVDSSLFVPPALLLATFIVLAAAFYWCDRILIGLSTMMNALLGRQVATTLRDIARRVPATVTYRLTDDELYASWSRGEKEITSWSRKLADEPYGLAGQACLTIFDHDEALHPTLYCFFSSGDELEQLRQALRARKGRVERLAPELMQDSTGLHPWPDGE